jgi:hypothetical protein
MDEVVEHLGEAVAAFFFYVLGGGGLAGRGRKADRSFRLRLHSGHRQSGSAFGAAFIGVAKATPYQSGILLLRSGQARVYAGPYGGWRLMQVSEVERRSDPTSQKRDVGHPARFGLLLSYAYESLNITTAAVHTRYAQQLAELHKCEFPSEP